MDKLSVEEYRLQAVSLLSWSVEQNARDTQMTTRVTGDARRERRLARECTPHTKSEEKERSLAVYEEYENGLKWVFENLLA